MEAHAHKVVDAVQAGPCRLAAARVSIQHPRTDQGRPLPAVVVIIVAFAIVINPVVLVQQQVDCLGVPSKVNQRVVHCRGRYPVGDGHTSPIGDMTMRGAE